MPGSPPRFAGAMSRIGFHASHEQIDPRRLLADVQHAEEAGFEMAMCSDHFSPWTSSQGHSGYTWSWLGAALATTDLAFGCVSAPGARYHPAVHAQKIATLAVMFPGRFWVALGSGEASNEHITGEPWPDKETRTRRLEECVTVIRALLAGEEVTHHGLVTVDRAQGVGAGRPDAAARRPGGLGRECGPGRRLGRRTGHRQPATRDAPQGDRRLPRSRRSWPGVAAAPPLLGTDRRRGARAWPTTSGRPTCSGHPCRWDTATVEAFDTLAAQVAARCRTHARAGVGRPRRAPGVDRGVRRPRVRRHLPPPRGAGPDGVHRRVRRARAPGLTDRADRRGAMSRMANTSDVWWKDAVIYCVDVETFQDSDGDGIGDFAGLTSRVDYLAELGITCLWLMPFYPTPDRDDGYDVTDLFGVDARLGTHGDLVELIRTAGRPRHPGDRRPRRQPHLRQAPVVQGGATQHDQPLPGLLRLARRPAARHLRPGRLPRQGGQHLGQGRRDRGVVPPPLLLPPAGPQLRQPGGA